MAVRLAYLAVVLIWTTTPLAIKWSSDGLSFILGVTARMSLGAICLGLTLLLTRRRLPLHRAACLTYLAVTLQLFVSMAITYWAAQHLPSGWISVILGLCPFMTAFMAAHWLQESSLGWLRILAYALGLAGLAAMFLSAADLHQQAIWALAAMLLAGFFHSFSAICVKKINARLPAIQQISGGLLVSVPCYWLSWYWLDGTIPAQIPQQALVSILYLGVFATTIGLVLYYYVLRILPATQVAMINLITPVLSLWLGYSVNHEIITLKVIAGTGLIMLALLIYQLAERRQNRSVLPISTNPQISD